MKWSPVAESQRIESLDILRGIAIFGILLVNMKSFSGPDSSIRTLSYDYFDEPYNVWTNVLLEFFVQGNFITMFSFLFGFGMILMSERAKANNRRFLPTFFRRQVVLFLFGAIHVLFFWYGDILVTYAIVGFIMLLFYRLPSKALLITGIVMLIAYSLFMTALTYDYWTSGAALSYQESLDAKHENEIETSIQIYSEGTYLEIMEERIREWLNLNQYFLFFLFGILPLFLFGAYAAKERPVVNKTLWKMWVLTLFLGPGSKMFTVLFFPYKGEDWRYETAMSWGYEFGGAMMSIFYMCTIVLLIRSGRFKRMFNMFRITGRMAFTNYLTQSVVCTFIFYSYGLGLYGEYGPLNGVLVAVILFSLQVLFSAWWLRNYRMGPLEWIWRTFTYGKQPILKRTKETLS
ncbi:DUF418 domain-containing protein [Fictibacillus phosphorivorans]|uniref:DUF418 domain-containing protein n=1 Tax=Fictibacillus phosphorivorans TaxID=1221500 RepID=UPI0020409ABE|nr:DUF418 domain-containing protein [Fictibacillus phosphorivorans]MCM3717401.1 DUF418 domain-containing protein [Fictibacillus phosphorivorans]MCM3775096.1 DUF418 domain-containing protein [Fictibacillus phosphorivorans]